LAASSFDQEEMEAFKTFVQKAGPYLLIEILLPGGTLLAMALWFFRRRAGLND
jgi:hypothetical protein